jgi:hypothetical protein
MLRPYHIGGTPIPDDGRTRRNDIGPGRRTGIGSGCPTIPSPGLPTDHQYPVNMVRHYDEYVQGDPVRMPGQGEPTIPRDSPCVC